MILKEIFQNRQWKISVNNNLIVCNWAVTFEDKQIWGEKERGDAVYIHRISTNPAFRGNRFIDIIVQWAKAYAKSLDRKYIRLDTLGNNLALIHYYTSAGFDFLGIYKLNDTSNLFAHYQKEPNCCLFEIKI